MHAREQLLAADPDPLEAGAGREAPQVARGEGVDVDRTLEVMAMGGGLGLEVALRGPDRAAPERRGEHGAALGHGGQQVAVARGLTAEGEGPDRVAAPVELREAALQSGMWWSTAWPKTRSKLSSSKGRRSASHSTVFTFRPSSEALLRSAFSMPGGCPVAVARSITPDWSRLRQK